MNQWFITDKRVIDPATGRLVYGKGRRIPMTEAIRLGLASSPKQGPEENKLLIPEENKLLVPEENKEVVFYCGSLTKSGKPCQIKVKNQGDKCKNHNMEFVRED